MNHAYETYGIRDIFSNHIAMPMSRGEPILLAIFFNIGMSSLYTYRYPFRGKNVLMFLNNCCSEIYSSIQDSKTLSGI